MTDKISVIVPVYKVEKYLDECVQSILHQTYQNLEIILVDDGSPDRCGELCDQYAAQDDRVRVIHKQNGGLSDSRNAGLDICTGDWISFIDSDDYVSHCFLEVMHRAAVENHAEIVALYYGENFWDGESGPILEEQVDEINCKTMSAREALEQMLYMKIATGAPFKIYSKNILHGIRFPYGYYYEDVATTYKAFCRAERISIVYNKLYAYRKRRDSIIRQPFSEKKLSAVKICDEMTNDPVINAWGMKDDAVARVFGMVYSVFLQVPDDQPETQKLVWAKVIQYRRSILQNQNPLMRRKNKIAALISYLGMSTSHTLGRKFGQKGTME